METQHERVCMCVCESASSALQKQKAMAWQIWLCTSVVLTNSLSASWEMREGGQRSTVLLNGPRHCAKARIRPPALCLLSLSLVQKPDYTFSAQVDNIKIMWSKAFFKKHTFTQEHIWKCSFCLFFFNWHFFDWFSRSELILHPL